MLNLTKGVSFVAIVLVASLAFLSCDEGNEAKSRGQTSIDGKVTVDAAASRSVEKSSMLAKFMSFFSLATSANAQGAGIQITAFQNGAEVDSATADDAGNFHLDIPKGGVITLRFETPGFTANEQIGVTPDSAVTLDITLVSATEVNFNTFEILSPQVRVRELESFDFGEERANLTIDGDGEDCIVATGSSEVDIKVSDLTITNCQNGIVGEDFANVRLEATAVPTLTIDAEDNAVHAKNDSSMVLIGTDISITGGTNGILATGTSGVQVQPTGECTIHGDDEAVDERDSSVVQTEDCTLTS